MSVHGAHRTDQAPVAIPAKSETTRGEEKR